jgi:hypothetical protein
MYAGVMLPFSILMASAAPLARSISAWAFNFSASKLAFASSIFYLAVLFCFGKFSLTGHLLLPNIVIGYCNKASNNQ